MARNTRTQKRAMRGLVRTDITDIRAALHDPRTFTALGVVFKEGGSHFEIINDDAGMDVMVHVKMQPDNEALFCRLGAAGGSGAGTGVWAIPAEGTEVAVLIPHGDIEGDTLILGILSTRSVPSELDETTMVIKGPSGGTVRVIADTVIIDAADEVKLGSDGASAGVATGDTVDPCIGLPLSMVSNVSSKVKADT